MTLDAAQTDRAIGAILAAAYGDALGSQYEFQPQIGPEVTPEFGYGTFGHAPGEWTDDTAMSVPVLLRLSEGGSFDDPESFAFVLDRWLEWSRTAKDVGIQTASVLSQLGSGSTEGQARAAAEALHEMKGRSAGNGSLMRTGPLALGYLGDGLEPDLVRAAARLAQLTHWEADNADACALWCLSIRRAILTGELDVAGQLRFLPAESVSRWETLIDEALHPDTTPSGFTESNGWVVAAFQASLSAINTTESPVAALEAAIRGGNDTDTIAAITGSLAGALYGASQLPLKWRDKVHGWPGLTGHDLKTLTCQAL